ncbi:hypothetical protein CARUB_v100151921mg, partial [Capsella rubella]
PSHSPTPISQPEVEAPEQSVSTPSLSPPSSIPSPDVTAPPSENNDGGDDFILPPNIGHQYASPPPPMFQGY